MRYGKMATKRAPCNIAAKRVADRFHASHPTAGIKGAKCSTTGCYW